MPYVKQMKIRHRMRIADIAFEMRKTGVLGAGKFAQAVDITKNIFFKKYTCFLSLAGPMVAGGLRQIIRDLVDDDYMNVIISTGANVTHDLIEALGYRHTIGTSKANDIKLKKNGIGRIYDINIGMEAFEGLEKWVYQILNELNIETKKNKTLITVKLQADESRPKEEEIERVRWCLLDNRFRISINDKLITFDQK